MAKRIDAAQPFSAAPRVCPYIDACCLASQLARREVAHRTASGTQALGATHRSCHILSIAEASAGASVVSESGARRRGDVGVS